MQLPARLGTLVALTLLTWPLSASAQVNVAPGGTATQSSDFLVGGVEPAVASRAIDGDTNGFFPNGSVTHTQGPGDPAPFWEVDLGRDHQIDEIVIWNRTDCCADRLYLFTVRIESEAGEEVSLGKVFNAPAQVDYRPTLPVGGAVGRFVRIEMDLDPANTDGRVLSLAEVQVFGAPLASAGLPLDRQLALEGLWKQKMKTVFDGPRDVVRILLAYLRSEGLDLDEVPYECSNSVDGLELGSIRFERGTGRFSLFDVYGRDVTGTFEPDEDNPDKIRMEADEGSQKRLKKMLKQASRNCFDLDEFEDEGTEQLAGLKVDLDKTVLSGKIVDGERFVLKGKLSGEVEWTRDSDSLGRFYGSGSTKYKFKLETPIVNLPTGLPAACLEDQGPHVYPDDGALLEGWVELTEIVGSDNFYLILSDDFVSILRDFEDDFQTIKAFLATIDELGVPCDDGVRSIVSVELTEFAKDNILFVAEKLAELELAVSALWEAFKNKILEPFYDWLAGEIAGQIADLVSKILKKIFQAILRVFF